MNNTGEIHILLILGNITEVPSLNSHVKFVVFIVIIEHFNSLPFHLFYYFFTLFRLRLNVDFQDVQDHEKVCQFSQSDFSQSLTTVKWIQGSFESGKG